MARRIFYAIDLLLCSLYGLFLWHDSVFFVMGIDLILLYALFMRMNISFMLYRKEKKSIWSIGILLLLLVVLLSQSSMADAAFKILQFPVNVLADRQMQSGIDWYAILQSRSYAVFACFLTFWMWILPIVVCLIQFFRKQQTGNSASLLSAAGGFIVKDVAGRKYLLLAVIFGTAYLIGCNMSFDPTRFGLMVLPAATYYLLNRWQGSRAAVWEYALVVVAMLLFLYAQYSINVGRIVMLAGSGLLVLVAHVACYLRNRRLGMTVVSFLLCAFVIPLLTTGYNIYTCTNTQRFMKFHNRLVHAGVLIVRGEDGYGIRDRYHMIVAPKMKRLSAIESEMSDPSTLDDEIQ